MKLFLMIIVSLIGIAGGLATADVMIRFIYQHRITENGIDIRLFGKILMKNISFSNVSEIRRVSFKETLHTSNIFTGLRLGICGLGSGIVILRLKKGIRLPFPPVIFEQKLLYIFPKNADEFVYQVLKERRQRITP